MERKESRQALFWGVRPLRRRCFLLCTNVKHAVSMYAQEADLTQRELTTEVWSEPLKRCDTMLCGLRSHDHLHSVACFLFGCLDLLLAGLEVMFGFLILVSFCVVGFTDRRCPLAVTSFHLPGPVFVPHHTLVTLVV